MSAHWPVNSWKDLASQNVPTSLLTQNNFRFAKNNRSTLFDTVTVIESNSLAGYFRLNWSNLCTRFKI